MFSGPDLEAPRMELLAAPLAALLAFEPALKPALETGFPGQQHGRPGPWENRISA